MIFVKQYCGRVQMEIHSMQMTEIEGRRHRIDDTQVMSRRKKTYTNTKTKYKHTQIHRFTGCRMTEIEGGRCGIDDTQVLSLEKETHNTYSNTDNRYTNTQRHTYRC